MTSVTSRTEREAPSPSHTPRTRSRRNSNAHLHDGSTPPYLSHSHSRRQSFNLNLASLNKGSKRKSSEPLTTDPSPPVDDSGSLKSDSCETPASSKSRKRESNSLFKSSPALSRKSSGVLKTPSSLSRSEGRSGGVTSQSAVKKRPSSYFTPPILRSYSPMLKYIADPYTCAAFKAFLASQFCEETLLFYLAVFFLSINRSLTLNSRVHLSILLFES